jgi:hypothetical protein
VRFTTASPDHYARKRETDLPVQGLMQRRNGGETVSRKFLVAGEPGPARYYATSSCSRQSSHLSLDVLE